MKMSILCALIYNLILSAIQISMIAQRRLKYRSQIRESQLDQYKERIRSQILSNQQTSQRQLQCTGRLGEIEMAFDQTYVGIHHLNESKVRNGVMLMIRQDENTFIQNRSHDYLMNQQVSNHEQRILHLSTQAQYSGISIQDIQYVIDFFLHLVSSQCRFNLAKLCLRIIADNLFPTVENYLAAMKWEDINLENRQFQTLKNVWLNCQINIMGHLIELHQGGNLESQFSYILIQYIYLLTNFMKRHCLLSNQEVINYCQELFTINFEILTTNLEQINQKSLKTALMAIQSFQNCNDVDLIEQMSKFNWLGFICNHTVKLEQIDIFTEVNINSLIVLSEITKKMLIIVEHQQNEYSQMAKLVGIIDSILFMSLKAYFSLTHLQTKTTLVFGILTFIKNCYFQILNEERILNFCTDVIFNINHSMIQLLALSIICDISLGCQKGNLVIEDLIFYYQTKILDSQDSINGIFLQYLYQASSFALLSSKMINF